MPNGSNSRGFRYSSTVWPVTFWTMAEHMYVAGVLYRKCVPGLFGTGWARNVFTQGSVLVNLGSVWWPVDMVSRSRTRIAFRFRDGSAGARSGKNESTSSSRLNFPSSTARPTAVEVKLLLSECITCGVSADCGFHQPSATTWPWRTSMKLCIVVICLSAASTNARTAAEETPWDSGVARGNAGRRDGSFPSAFPGGTSAATAAGEERRAAATATAHERWPLMFVPMVSTRHCWHGHGAKIPSHGRSRQCLGRYDLASLHLPRIRANGSRKGRTREDGADA